MAYGAETHMILDKWATMLKKREEGFLSCSYVMAVFPASICFKRPQLAILAKYFDTEIKFVYVCKEKSVGVFGNNSLAEQQQQQQLIIP